MTLGMRIEKLDPGFLACDISSYQGDDVRLIFKVKYPMRTYLVECQLLNITSDFTKGFVLIKEYNSQYITNIREISSIEGEDAVIKAMCDFLDNQFPINESECPIDF